MMALLSVFASFNAAFPISLSAKQQEQMKNSTKNCVSDAFMSFLFLVGTFKPLLDSILPQEINPSAINNTTFLSCQWFFYFVYLSCRLSDQCQLKICVVLRQHIHVADIFYIINANHKISKFIPKHLSKRLSTYHSTLRICIHETKLGIKIPFPI